MSIKPAKQQEIIDYCKNPDLRNYVCLIMRPGIYAFMVELEYTRFKPDTPENEGFHVSFSKWPLDDPINHLTMVIVSIDKRGQDFADSILWKHGLRKVKPGFVPCIYGKGWAKGIGVMATDDPRFMSAEPFFLGVQDNVFYLENHSKGAENVIYANDPEKLAKAREHEMSQVQPFFDAHKAWLETPEGKAIADAFWATKPSGEVR